MPMILQYLLRNIAEKKSRTALIVLAVLLSTALLLATTGMSTTMEAMFARRLSQYFGSAQIEITNRRNSPSWLHAPGKLQRSDIPYEYAVPSIWTNGEIRQAEGDYLEIAVRGFPYDGLMEMAPPVFLDPPPRVFRGNMVIIGSHTAELLGVGVGDTFTIHIQDTPHRFAVVAVAASVGIFTFDGRQHAAVIPLDKIATAVAGRGRASITYVRVGEPEMVSQTIDAIQEIYPRYRVEETVTEKEIAEWTREMTTPFTIISFLVFFMSVFIIYTCFRVITVERLPVIGTFRSVGATRRATTGLLLAESALYGLLGGLPGCVAGIGVLRLLVHFTSWDWLRDTEVVLVITPVQVIVTLVLAITLSAGSALIPIAQAARLPVKDVILGTVKHTLRRRTSRYVVGVVLLAVGTGLPHFLPRKLMMAAGSLSMFLIIVAIVMVLPWVVRHLVKLAGAVNRKVFGNIGDLASKNLRDDPSVLNNIALLTIGVTGLFMITTMSMSAADSVTRFFRHARFDVWFWTSGANRTTEARLRSIPGVEETLGIYEKWNTKIVESDHEIRQIQGVLDATILDWWTFPVHHEDPVALINSLNDRRSMVVSLNLKRLLGLEVGDSITLLFGEDENRPRTYSVVGFFTSPDDAGGHALVGSRWLKMDSGRTRYSDIWIRAPGTADSVKSAIEEKYRRKPLWVTTMTDMETENTESMRQIFLMLQFFSFLAMLIGSVGIVNNYLVSFIERRRVLAVIRSVGMSRDQARRMLFIEALTGGVFGALIGLVGGAAIISFMPPYMLAFDLSLEVVVRGWQVGVLLAMGALLSMGAQVIPSLRSRRMNLIEALKYE